MAIRYEVTSGVLPVTVYLMQGLTEIAHNHHNIYEEGQFDDVVYGEYTLYAVDSMLCELSLPVSGDTVLSCDVLMVTGDTGSGDYKIYSYNPYSKTATLRFNLDYYSTDIACTDTRLWVINGSECNTIKEYIINLNPFTITYNRELSVPVNPVTGHSALDYGNGLEIVEADDDSNYYKLIGSEWEKYRFNYIVYDNTTVGVAEYGVVNTGKFLAGDIKYHPIQNLYTGTFTDYYDPNLREIITYALGYRIKKWILTISPTIMNPWGLFIFEDSIYITDRTEAGTDIYKVFQDRVELYDTIPGVHVQGAAQLTNCGTFVPFTTTTTTTVEPTTTTTSTTIEPTTTTTTTTGEPFVWFSLTVDTEEINYIDIDLDITEENANKIYVEMGDGIGVIYPVLNEVLVTPFYYIDLSGYTYPAPGTYTINFYSSQGYDPTTDVFYIDIEGVNVQNTTLDFTNFTGLKPDIWGGIYLYEDEINSNLVEEVIFPSSTWSRTGDVDLEAVEFTIGNFNNISTIEIPSYDSYPRLSFYGLSLLSSFIFNEGSKFTDFLVENCPLLSTIDFSDITFYVPPFSSCINMLNCETLTSITFPQNILPWESISQFAVSINECPNIGYVNFNNLQYDPTFSVGYILIANNAYTSDIVNHLFTDFDNIDWGITSNVFALGGDYALNYPNECPDSSSGGYNGTAAIASLIGKGHDPRINDCVTTTSTTTTP